MVRVLPLITVFILYWLPALGIPKGVPSIQYCSAEWMQLATHRNLNDHEVTQSFVYQVGTRNSYYASRPHYDKPVSVLASVSVRTRLSSSMGSAEIRSSHRDLAEYNSMYSSVHVPAWSSVTVWQLVAKHQHDTVAFGHVVTVGEKEPPPRITSCQATYYERKRISQSSWVRLKHENTGKYLTLTTRNYWDAGTLGYSSSYLYRFEPQGSDVYRIETGNNRHYGYKYAYSSMAGGIYFDWSDTSNEKQLWTLSTNDLRDGDSITIQNVYYYGGYMVRYDGWSTDVYCIYTYTPDRWTVELVD